MIYIEHMSERCKEECFIWQRLQETIVEDEAFKEDLTHFVAHPALDEISGALAAVLPAVAELMDRVNESIDAVKSEQEKLETKCDNPIVTSEKRGKRTYTFRACGSLAVSAGGSQEAVFVEREDDNR